MELGKIVEQIHHAVHIEGDVSSLSRLEIMGVAYDSRQTAPDKIFACIRGEHTDGHRYVEDALVSGCKVVLCEKKLSHLGDGVIQIIVTNPRSFMGRLSSILFDNPSEKMIMIAFTGTNGKTTSAYMTRAILETSKEKCGMIGTVAYYDGNLYEDADRTTPEGPDIQALLRKMVTNRCRYCVMEASSHGLEQGRLEGCSFDRVAFSNLSQEHLEYHQNMERYFKAKKLLFSDYVRGRWEGIINRDDPYGLEMINEYPKNSLSYGVTMPIKGEFWGGIKEYSINGMEADIIFPDSSILPISLPFIGTYNLQNVLQAIAVTYSLGIDKESIRYGVQTMQPVPGRLERYILDNGVCCVIDFAHSPDGLYRLLSTIKDVCKKKLRIVWGAGGDRTPLKRPIAGKVMAEWADDIIITNDNPRSEDPETIAKHVCSGITGENRCRIILDRREAIYSALNHAEKGDIVVIAGKGPEKHMLIGEDKIPFEDARVMMEWCRVHSVGVQS